MQVEVELPSGDDGEDDGEGVDFDDLDSDVDCMEGLDGEVVAVRTYALEEQATACQMMLLLAEALQVSATKSSSLWSGVHPALPVADLVVAVMCNIDPLMKRGECKASVVC